MSRFKKLWVLLVPTVLLGLLGPPAQANNWEPVPPTPQDVCGTRYDRYYLAEDFDAGYRDGGGNSLSAGAWHLTGGAASVTVVASHWSGDERTYNMTFGTEPDAGCVEADDTVTTAIVGCNTATNGTLVTFTYTNQAEPSGTTGAPHTRPALAVTRWDYGQSAYFAFTEAEVADGQQVSVTGGDEPDGTYEPHDFFLAPGTYDMKLTTNETGSRVLPNRLFVPACGDYSVPPGDPRGGQSTPVVSKPSADVGKCRAHRLGVSLNNRKSTQATRYRVVVDPRRGRTQVRVLNVRADSSRVEVFRRLKGRTVVVVTFKKQEVKRVRWC